MEHLEPWLTPMQAVVWVVMRDPVCVRRASLDAEVSLAAHATLNGGLIEGVRPGLSLQDFENLIYFPVEESFDIIDRGVGHLLESVRSGKVCVYEEDHLPVKVLGDTRRKMDALEWADLALERSDEDGRNLIVCEKVEAAKRRGKNEITPWKNVYFDAAQLIEIFPRRFSGVRKPNLSCAPSGTIFIDQAILLAVSKLSIPEGPVTRRLLNGLLAGEIRSFHYTQDLEHDCIKLRTIFYENWSGAGIDLLVFRGAGRAGLGLNGRCLHLRSVVLAADDFEFWLSANAQPSALPDAKISPALKRPSRGVNYEEADKPLVDAALEGLRNKKFKNPTDAARHFADKASGSGAKESIRARLTRRISQAYDLER